MKDWFASLGGVVTLSFSAFISMLLRSYLDTRYILPEDFGHLGMGFTMVWVISYTAIIGGWVWALITAIQNSKAGLITLLVYSVITALGFGVASLILFASHPIEFVIFSLNSATGALAFSSAMFRLKV